MNKVKVNNLCLLILYTLIQGPATLDFQNSGTGHFKVFPRSRILICKVHVFDVTVKLVFMSFNIAPIQNHFNY